MTSLVKINSIRYFGTSPNQLIANIDVTSHEDSENIDFFVALDHEDDSDIYREIIRAIHNDEVEILPSLLSADEALSSQIREERDRLLNETDKYMSIDYPITDECRSSLRVYRQALRDIPSQDNFPSNIVWPEMPAITKQ